MGAVFDDFAKDYDAGHQKAVSASGFNINYFYEYKVKEAHRLLTKHNMEFPRSVLDFGCGVGNVDPYIRRYFPNAEIYGTDISRESIEIAKEKNREHNISYAVFDPSLANSIPFDTAFDMIFVSCVFHHIPRSEHSKTLALLKSRLNPGGLLFIFEHNPYNPATRLVFYKHDKLPDKNANLIYPHYLKKRMRKQGIKVLWRNFTVFFPKFLSIFIPLEKYMTGVPMGAQYYVCGKKEDIGE